MYWVMAIWLVIDCSPKQLPGTPWCQSTYFKDFNQLEVGNTSYRIQTHGLIIKAAQNRFRMAVSPLPTSSFSTSGCHVWLEDCQTPDWHTWWPVSHQFKLSSTLPRKKMESLEIFPLIRIPSWKAPSFPFHGEHRYLRLLRHFDFRPQALQKELQLNASMKAKEKPWEKPKAWSWRKNQGRFQSPDWKNQRGAMSHHHVE